MKVADEQSGKTFTSNSNVSVAVPSESVASTLYVPILLKTLLGLTVKTKLLKVLLPKQKRLGEVHFVPVSAMVSS